MTRILARRSRGEVGQSLIEVLVALSVLVVVLVPALFLVTDSTKVVYNSQFKVTAANLANGQLEIDRNQMVTQPAPTLPTPASPVQKGSEWFSITQVSGPCTPPGHPYGDGVMVTVTWNLQKSTNGTGKLDSGSVQVAGVLTTPVGITLSGTCPL
jgi:type II secretory pathway pseudopilin PulG